MAAGLVFWSLRYLDSFVLTDLPTLISINHNGDDEPEDNFTAFNRCCAVVHPNMKLHQGRIDQLTIN